MTRVAQTIGLGKHVLIKGPEMKRRQTKLPPGWMELALVPRVDTWIPRKENSSTPPRRHRPQKKKKKEDFKTYILRGGRARIRALTDWSHRGIGDVLPFTIANSKG
jgi:hypothetical protein